jgi:hypothetical protein
MKEFGEALKLIFGKIGDFIDIFDLSFFISGFAVATAVLLHLHLHVVTNIQSVGGKTLVFVFVLACYIFGLICFATGRWIRMSLVPFIMRQKRSQKFDEMFTNALAGHQLLDKSPYKEYLGNTEYRGVWRLYIRLWADVRHNSDLDQSSQVLRRYWVMAATYDGLIVALIVWSLFFVNLAFNNNHVFANKMLLISGSACLLFIAVLCMREAGRFVKYQVEELVATIASDRETNRLTR